MPLPSYLKDSATVLDHVIKTAKNPYVVGVGGVISIIVEVLRPMLNLFTVRLTPRLGA